MYYALYYPKVKASGPPSPTPEPDTMQEPPVMFNADIYSREYVERWKHENMRTCIIVPVTPEIDPLVALGMSVVDGVVRG